MVDPKTKPKKTKKTERKFGPIIRRMRVTDESDAKAMTKAGARMTREDESGFHFELDEQACKDCGV